MFYSKVASIKNSSAKEVNKKVQNDPQVQLSFFLVLNEKTSIR